MKEIQPLTGYIRGGCSPIGMKKNFESYIDETAQLYNDIYVSAGIRGMQIKISPSKLKEVINAQFYDIIWLSVFSSVNCDLYNKVFI